MKEAIDAICLALVAPAAALCAIERRVGSGREGMFSFWAQSVALVPGVPGVFVRRAFYRLTLDRASRHIAVAFGAVFTHRRAIVEDDVYLGSYALVGCARLRRGCLVGSRASIVSGGRLHELGEDGHWDAFDPRRLEQIDVGEDVWIGEGAIVMAPVGERSVVAAGAVVSAPVAPGVVVAGNPARFARHLAVPPASGKTLEENAHGVPIPAVR